MADNVTNDALGDPISTKNQVLQAGAGMTQDFRPINQICAFLNAFRVYASDPKRYVEANHYCTHVNEEYMITKRLYETLPKEERMLWHSHEFEVKSGMLIMPGPDGLPNTVWETAENAEMEEVVGLYGKTYHFWQVDRGDELPLVTAETWLIGPPQLVMAFAEPRQFPDFKKAVGDRDARFHVDHQHKAEIRKHIPVSDIHPGETIEFRTYQPGWLPPSSCD